MSIILDDIERELTVEELLSLVLEELRILNTYMGEGFEEHKTIEDIEDR